MTIMFIFWSILLKYTEPYKLYPNNVCKLDKAPIVKTFHQGILQAREPLCIIFLSHQTMHLGLSYLGLRINRLSLKVKKAVQTISVIRFVNSTISPQQAIIFQISRCFSIILNSIISIYLLFEKSEFYDRAERLWLVGKKNHQSMKS